MAIKRCAWVMMQRARKCGGDQHLFITPTAAATAQVKRHLGDWCRRFGSEQHRQTSPRLALLGAGWLEAVLPSGVALYRRSPTWRPSSAAAEPPLPRRWILVQAVAPRHFHRDGSSRPPHQRAGHFLRRWRHPPHRLSFQRRRTTLTPTRPADESSYAYHFAVSPAAPT